MLEGLSKSFGPTKVIDDLCLRIPREQFVGVIGRSGAGKSTTLRMVNRLTEPNAGRVTWNGADITAFSGRSLRDWRRRCAMIFQQFNLIGRLDVLENVLIGRLAHAPAWRSLSKAWSWADRAVAMAALEQMDIAHLATQRADSLSGGQQQRVAICRALVQEPEIVLADEPVASLDPRNTRVVMDALRHINRQYGLLVLCNLHSLDLARAYCDRLIGMAAGRVVFDGPPSALTAEAVGMLYGFEAGEVADPVSALPPASPPSASPAAVPPHTPPSGTARETVAVV